MLAPVAGKSTFLLLASCLPAWGGSITVCFCFVFPPAGFLGETAPAVVPGDCFFLIQPFLTAGLAQEDKCYVLKASKLDLLFLLQLSW